MKPWMIEQGILWLILVGTVWVCGAMFVYAWRERPMVMRDQLTGHYTSVRSWQKEHGYGSR